MRSDTAFGGMVMFSVGNPSNAIVQKCIEKIGIFLREAIIRENVLKFGQFSKLPDPPAPPLNKSCVADV